MSNTFVTLVVPESFRGMAQAICSMVGGEYGEGMFTTGLGIDDRQPPTHYISSGLIGVGFYELLSSPQTLTNMLGGDFSIAEVTDLLNSSDISQEQPFDVIGRLGLRIV
jgi:hypothetical protein